MRKITKQIAEAFNNHQPRTIGNTHTDGKAVWIHGNKILERREDGLYFTLAGWNTPTTRERLRAWASVRSIGGVPRYMGAEIDSGTWYKVGGQSMKYHQTNKAHPSAFEAAPAAARHAKCKAWTAASVILFKPQGITRHIGTRY